MESPSNNKDQNKVLCMFSGGLDSLGVLYLLLTHPGFQNREIHVHHLKLQNLEKRAKVEKVACEKIISYLKSNGYRIFTYTESSHDVSILNRYFIYDSIMYGFMAANLVINDPKISSIAIGSNGDDRKNTPSIIRANKGRSLFQTMLPEQLKYKTDYIYPVAHLSKLQIWQMLPPELRSLSWSCRKPIYKGQQAHACKKCKTCVEMERLKKADAQSEWAHPLGLG